MQASRVTDPPSRYMTRVIFFFSFFCLIFSILHFSEFFARQIKTLTKGKAKKKKKKEAKKSVAVTLCFIYLSQFGLGGPWYIISEQSSDI